MTRYALVADMYRYIPAAVLGPISSSDQQAALDDASSTAAGYLSAQYTLPLVEPYPSDLRRYVCWMAIYDLMCRRGYNPEEGMNDVYGDRHDQAVLWLRDVSKGIVVPDGIQDSSATQRLGGARAKSKASRGW
jgi:phage gp36-like protein